MDLRRKNSWQFGKDFERVCTQVFCSTWRMRSVCIHSGGHEIYLFCISLEGARVVVTNHAHLYTDWSWLNQSGSLEYKKINWSNEEIVETVSIAVAGSSERNDFATYIETKLDKITEREFEGDHVEMLNIHLLVVPASQNTTRHLSSNLTHQFQTTTLRLQSCLEDT